MASDYTFESELADDPRPHRTAPLGVPGKIPTAARLGRVQRKESRDGNGVAADADQHLDRAAGSSGAPLPDDLRGRFESSLGADLSGVRVHTGADSGTAAHAVGARAYTVGNDIHFGAGQYDPSSSSGQFLIAHEVAHTVQQAGAAPHRQHKLEVSAPADSAEVEADRAAEAMMVGAAATVGSAPVAAYRKPTASGEIGLGGISVALSREFKHSVPGKYANLEFSVPIQVTGALKPKQELPAGVGREKKQGGSSSTKGNVEIYKKEAEKSSGDALLDLAKKDVDQADYSIDKAELEGDYGTSTSPGGTPKDTKSINVAIKLTHKNGRTTSVQATLWEMTKGAADSSKVTTLELSHVFKLVDKKLWQNEDAELSLTATLALKGAVKPNWATIFAELGKKNADKLRPLANAALQALASEAFIVGGFAAIAASTAFAFVMGVSEISDMKTTGKACMAAIASYAKGYCAGLNVPAMGAKNAEFFGQGKKEGAARLTATKAKIRTHPMFVSWEFTDEELDAVLGAGAFKNAQALYDECYTRVEDPIKRRYIAAFYQREKDSLLGRFRAHLTARDLAHYLGITDWTPPDADAGAEARNTADADPQATASTVGAATPPADGPPERDEPPAEA